MRAVERSLAQAGDGLGGSSGEVPIWLSFQARSAALRAGLHPATRKTARVGDPGPAARGKNFQRVFLLQA
jgi:hypothetical protein